MITFDAVLAYAEQLPIVDRARLIEALWETIPEQELPPISPEWLEEIRRRSAALECGETKSVPMETVMAELKARSAQRHGHAQG